MKTTIFWVVLCYTIVGSHNQNQNEDILLSKFGIIIHRTDIEVIVDKESLLVNTVYDTRELRYVWNSFLEDGDALIEHIGYNNRCVNKVLEDGRSSREKIRRWLNTTLNATTIREKRQVVAMLGGMASMFTMGLTQWEISKIHEKINEIQTSVDHNEGKLRCQVRL